MRAMSTHVTVKPGGRLCPPARQDGDGIADVAVDTPAETFLELAENPLPEREPPRAGRRPLRCAGPARRLGPERPPMIQFVFDLFVLPQTAPGPRRTDRATPCKGGQK